MIKTHIRWMIRKDMSDVIEIENDNFEFSWCKDDFVRCLRARNTIGMVAEFNDKVVGFMIYYLNKNSIGIMNLAIAKEYQRHGIGHQFCKKLTDKLTTTRRTRITLEVRETNLAAQLFFKAEGFKAINIIKDFYDDTTEDAYVFQYRIHSTGIDPFPNRITNLVG